MKPSFALSLLGVSLVCSGCALFEDGGRNLCVSLSTPIETHRENARNRRWAEQAWQEVAGKDASCKRTDDYALGFKAGFAEYLFRGGDCEPPLVAPLKYRHARYQTQQGYQAIEEWFAGYRHGATLARDSGARRWITGPSGMALEPHGDVMPDPATFLPGRPADDVWQREAFTPPQFLPMPPIDPAPPGAGKTEFGLPRSGISNVPPAPILRELPPSPYTAPMATPNAPPEIIQSAPLQKPIVAEPAKVRIKGVSAAPAIPGTTNEAPISRPKAKIMGVMAPPPPARELSIEPQPLPEPVRARIKAITVAPSKEP